MNSVPVGGFLQRRPTVGGGGRVGSFVLHRPAIDALLWRFQRTRWRSNQPPASSLIGAHADPFPHLHRNESGYGVIAEDECREKSRGSKKRNKKIERRSAAILAWRSLAQSGPLYCRRRHRWAWFKWMWSSLTQIPRVDVFRSIQRRFRWRKRDILEKKNDALVLTDEFTTRFLFPGISR